MAKRMRSLTPNQKELSKKPLDQIIQEAKNLPPSPVAREPKDMLPIIIILKEEKGMFWTEIADWLRDNTEFYRSATSWSILYKEEKENQAAALGHISNSEVVS